MAHAAVTVLVENDEFCSAYFPNPSNPSPNKPKPVLTENPFSELAHLKTFEGNEADIREAFVNAVNTHNLIPGLALRKCGERPDGFHSDATRQVGDVAWYFERDLHGDGEQEWGNQVIPVVFKLADDPFDNNNTDGSTSTGDCKNTYRQCITYSELLHAVQQRTALFMLVVIGRRVRFTRWDHSGTVVTSALDSVTNWQLFCDILWRISRCSDAQLGLDPTATRVYDTDPDYLTMFEAANMENTVDHSQRVLEDAKLPEGEFTYVRDMFKNSLKDKWPCYRVKVPDGANVREFLIGKPVFRAKGIVGRGTRGYVALDCATKRFVWLKDAWRANREFVRKEGDVLAALNAAEVYNVPTMVCHGDIAGQATETPAWWEHKNARTSASSSSDGCVNPSSSVGMKRKLDDNDEAVVEPATKDGFENVPLRLDQHYRLVVEEVGMPLDHLRYPQQLVVIIFDSVRAHFEAATKPKEPLLHRDISPGNILIYPRVIEKSDGSAQLQWRGILVDWEMSNPVRKGEGPMKAGQTERMGTPQYLSVALLSSGPVRASLPDELESFFHVLLYCALRYVKSTNCDGWEIADFLYTYFDVYSFKGKITCSAVKHYTIQLGGIRVNNGTYLRFGNPLDFLFVNLLSWFRARYIVLAYDSQDPPAVQSPKASRYGNDVELDSFAAQLAARESDFKQGAPTMEERMLAKRLEVHDQMLQFLLKAMREPWPSQVAADQIPP